MSRPSCWSTLAPPDVHLSPDREQWRAGWQCCLVSQDAPVPAEMGADLEISGAANDTDLAFTKGCVAWVAVT